MNKLQFFLIPIYTFKYIFFYRKLYLLLEVFFFLILKELSRLLVHLDLSHGNWVVEHKVKVIGSSLMLGI